MKVSIFDDFEEKNRLLKLQKDYESGIIKEEELSEQQKQQLMELYNEQIKNLEEEINRTKVEMKMYKHKIKNKIEMLKKKKMGE